MATETVDNNILGTYPVRVVRASGDTADIQTMTSGFELPYYDYVSVTYPSATQEVYVFKTGGSGGTTVGTITLNYTDATKVNLLNAERT